MASVIPAARLYFLNMCRLALPQDVFIWYGKRLGVFSAPITLQCFGWTASQEPAELGPNLRREETFDLKLCLSSFAGDQDFDAREAECMSNWSLITTALGNDGSLGNIVRWAQITDYEFSPNANADGQSIGNLDFTVNCQQRIESMS